MDFYNQPDPEPRAALHSRPAPQHSQELDDLEQAAFGEHGSPRRFASQAHAFTHCLVRVHEMRRQLDQLDGEQSQPLDPSIDQAPQFSKRLHDLQEAVTGERYACDLPSERAAWQHFVDDVRDMRERLEAAVHA
jgi:hypothetical protein